MNTLEKEDGMIMIESIYVVVTAIMIIFLSINFGVLYHNSMVLSAVANETANGIGELFGSISKEPKYAYTSNRYFVKRDVYRSMNIGKLQRVAERKAKWYCASLLDQAEIAPKNAQNFQDSINVSCEKNELGEYAVNVYLKREYPVLIPAASAFFGLDLDYTLEAQGTAICYDLMAQMNGRAFVMELQNKIDNSNSFTRIGDKLLEIIYQIINL